MSGIITIVILCVLAIVAIFLCTLAWQIRNLIGKLVAGIVSTIIALALTAVSIVGLVSIYRLYTPHGPGVTNFTGQASPTLVAMEQKHAQYCAGCHSTNGNEPLSGGDRNFLGPQPGQGGGGLGALYAPNLTPGGPLKGWTDAEIVRAIRDGVDKDGHPLIIMPSDAFHHLSDAETQALVAYLRSQPAVSHTVPVRNLNLIGTLLVGTGLFPTSAQPAEHEPVTAPQAGVTPRYGQYLVQTIGCASCHGERLTGKKPGQGPAGPNLTYIVPKWSAGQFQTFFSSGVDPTGHMASSEMPWQTIAKAYDQNDLEAIYAYLHSLPATPGPTG